MIPVYILFCLLIAFGLYRLVTVIFGFPLHKAAEALRNIHGKRTLTQRLQGALLPPARLLAKLFPMGEYKVRRMEADFSRLHISQTPQEFVSVSLARSLLLAMIGLMFIPLGIPWLALLTAVAAVLSFFQRTQSIRKKVEVRNREIEAELPRLTETLNYSLQENRDLLTFFEKYRRVAGKALGFELDRLILEMKTGNMEAALRRMDARLGLPPFSALCAVLCGVYQGVDQQTTATVKNIGLVSAPSHTLRLTPGNLAVQNKTVGSLVPGASSTVTYTFTAPINVTDTSMTLTVAADPTNVIAEADETNNTATKTISIKAGLPDLDVISITTNKSTYDASETVTVTVVDKNIGLVSAPSHVLRLAPGSLAIQDKTVSALAPGATATITYSFTTPVKGTTFSMTLTATADPANAVSESDETNNSASTSINVNAGLPDLTVTALSTDKSTYDAGEPVTVTSTVANQGAVSVSNPVIRLTPGTLTMQGKTVSSIAAGASAIVSWTFAAPANLSASSLLLTATADPLNVIAESDETNNSRSMKDGRSMSCCPIPVR